MTKRVIKTAVGTYVGKRGGEPFVGAYGWKGDEVDVHEDFLEEFDAVNLETGDGKIPVEERVGVEVVSPSTAADKSEDEEAPEDKTVVELKADLDAAGVDYPSNARKDELVELVKKL